MPPTLGRTSGCAEPHGRRALGRAPSRLVKAFEVNHFSRMWITVRGECALLDSDDQTFMTRGTRTAIAAWMITAVYYFYQYALRSAPAVMMPQLSEAFGVSAMGVASIVGLF